MSEKVTFNCTFGILGMDPEPGTMTLDYETGWACFESTDGKTKTRVHRSMLAQGNIEWPT